MQLFNKPRFNKNKITLFAAVGIIYAIMCIFDTGCIIKSITGFPCLGCGMTRAWLSVARIDFGSAFTYHTMFWTAPIIFGYALCDGMLFKNQKINLGVANCLFSAFIINWLFQVSVNIAKGC